MKGWSTSPPSWGSTRRRSWCAGSSPWPREVHDLYRTRFNVPESEQDITAALLDGPGLEGPDEHPDAVAKLEAAGFTQAAAAIEVFKGWAEGRHASTGSERARTIIREILHEIVDALGKTPDPDGAVTRMDRFLAGLPEDLSFFSMLRANTWLLNLIAVVMGSAPRMADVLEATRGCCRPCWTHRSSCRSRSGRSWPGSSMNALPAGGTPRKGSSRWPPGPETSGFRWRCRPWRT